VSVTAAKGFVAAGVRCGLRKKGLDLALVQSTEPATGGAVFTVNRVQAAPLLVSREHLAAGEPRAVVVNSGNANAATGEKGLAAARLTAETAAGRLGLRPEEVLVLSTGVIGVPLPVEAVLTGVQVAAAELSADGGASAAEAILTTDTRSKQAVAHGPGFTVGGMAKGSGMIHPNLATMLAVITTDYALEPGEAVELLRPAVDTSFNSISVDGECSTNDAVVLLANGASRVSRSDELDAEFAEALGSVCEALSKQIVADGEGATLVAEIAVSGAASDAEARAIAQRIATSSLVKTALFGRDANWGRVLAAAGSAPFNGGYAHLDPETVTLRFNGSTVLTDGSPSEVEPDVSGDTCSIELDLGLGEGSARYLTSDLSFDYVKINAEYRT
jgi:glutamate N-acetyltransferase/amino-acid N-acetyltransferase